MGVPFSKNLLGPYIADALRQLRDAGFHGLRDGLAGFGLLQLALLQQLELRRNGVG